MPDKENSRIDPEQALDEEFRDKWLDKKHDAWALADVYQSLGMKNRSERVRDCGSFLEYITPADFSEKPKLHYANFCRDRLCPLCTWRRTMKIFGQVSQIMEIIGQDYRFLFCTLTVRNCSGEELPEMVDQMQKAWNRLMTYKEIRKAFHGFFRALEITRHPEYRREIEYHPHFHIIFAVNRSYFTDSKYYIKTARMVQLWGKALDIDYDPVCDLRTVKPKEAEKVEWDSRDIPLNAAVAEVAKYSVKSKDYLKGSFPKVQKTVAVFLASLSGRRLCSFGGVFKEAKLKLGLDDEIDGDLVHTDGQEKLRADVRYILLQYRWQVGLGYELQILKDFIPEDKHK